MLHAHINVKGLILIGLTFDLLLKCQLLEINDAKCDKKELREVSEIT